MRLMRSTVAVALAKKLYDEAQKPENQRRMRETYEKVKTRQQERKRR